jgi:hypothetical protein
MGALWRGEDEVVPPASSSYSQYRRLAGIADSPRTAPKLPRMTMARPPVDRPRLKGSGAAGSPACARPRRCSGIAGDWITVS